MKTRDLLFTARVGMIPPNALIESLTRDPKGPHGRILVEKDKAGNTKVGHLTTLPNQPWASSRIKDNYSIQTGLQAGSKGTVHQELQERH